MDLFSLDATPAQLIRNTTFDNSLTKTVDQEKLRSDIQNKTGSVKQLNTDDEISALIGIDHSKGISYISIHSSSIFFQSKVDLTQDPDDKVQIGKASFSKEEFNLCHDFIQNIRSDLSSKSFLDYDDYAKQAVLSNVVADFAKKNLNEDQSQVLNSAMSDYVTSQQLLAQKNCDKKDIQDSSFDEIKKYYGKTATITQEMANEINSSFSNINFKTNVKAGTKTVLPQATNEELKNSLTELFSNVDFNDQNQLSGALKQYKELLKPVYTSLNQGIVSDNLEKILEQKSSDLMNMVQKYRKYTSPSVSVYA